MLFHGVGRLTFLGATDDRWKLAYEYPSPSLLRRHNSEACSAECPGGPSRTELHLPTAVACLLLTFLLLPSLPCLTSSLLQSILKLSPGPTVFTEMSVSSIFGGQYRQTTERRRSSHPAIRGPWHTHLGPFLPWALASPLKPLENPLELASDFRPAPHHLYVSD